MIEVFSSILSVFAVVVMLVTISHTNDICCLELIAAHTNYMDNSESQGKLVEEL